MKNISLLYLALVFFIGTGAQPKEQPQFVVYFSSGKATVETQGKGQLIKKGAKIFKNDKVRLAAGAKLILVCTNYQTIELTKAGVFSVASLKNNCTAKNTSLTAAYFKYVWEEFTHPHSSPEKKPEKYMQTAGAVTRGKDPVTMALQADTLKILSGDFKLNFLPASDTLRLVIFNRSLSQTRPVYAASVTKAVPLGDAVKRLSGIGVYHWQLIDKRNRRGPFHTLILLTEKEYETALAEVYDATKDINNAAEKAFMTAFTLEKQHFLSEAERFYRKASALAPKNTTYSAFLKRFL